MDVTSLPRRSPATRDGRDRGEALAVPVHAGAGRRRGGRPRRRRAGCAGEHWDARHHCSAFVLGPGRRRSQRSSDDGEPAGHRRARRCSRCCAAAEVSDVVAVVTRWFGGTLLGAGGLVRAYGDAVRAGLDAAGHPAARLLPRARRSTSAHADAGRRRERPARPRGRRARRDVRRAGHAAARRRARRRGAGARPGRRADRRRRRGRAVGERWVDRAVTPTRRLLTPEPADPSLVGLSPGPGARRGRCRPGRGTRPPSRPRCRRRGRRW